MTKEERIKIRQILNKHKVHDGLKSYHTDASLEAAMEEYSAQENRWIPVSEALPTIGIKVLAWYKGLLGPQVIVRLSDHEDLDPIFTHWKEITPP